MEITKPNNSIDGWEIYKPEFSTEEITIEGINITTFNFDNFTKVAQFWLREMNTRRWAPDTEPDLWICNKNINLKPYTPVELDAIQAVLEHPTIKKEYLDLYKDKKAWPGNQNYPVEYAVLGFISTLAGVTKGYREHTKDFPPETLSKALQAVEKIPTSMDVIGKISLAMELDYLEDGTIDKLASFYGFGLQAYDKFEQYFGFFGGIMGIIKR